MATDRKHTLVQALLADGYELVNRRMEPGDLHTWGLTARKGEYELVIEEYPVHAPLFDRHRTG